MRKKLLKIACLAVLVSILGGGYSLAWADVAIDEAHFPDYYFRAYISDNFDKDRNGVLSTAEAAAATVIKLYNEDDGSNVGVNSLKGIEYFTALTELNYSNNSIEDLDLSKNTALTILICHDSYIEDLDLSANVALKILDCRSIGLEKLNLTKNTALVSLDCAHNYIEELDLSKNTALVSMDCGGNNLTKLDVSKNLALRRLYCSDNNSLGKLDVTKNTALTILDCRNLGLEELDLSKNVALTFLECRDNRLVDLNLGQHSALVHLDCSNNQLGELDLSSKTALTYLKCNDNPLGELNLNSNTALTELYCYNNLLGELDVSKNTALTILDCSYNPLGELDLGTNTELVKLDCYENQLTKLDLRHNTALTEVNCYNNKLTTLDVSECAALTKLDCGYNQLTAIDVSKSRGLTDLLCYDNKLEALDVKSNIHLKTLDCSHNELKVLDLSKNTALESLTCSGNHLVVIDLKKNTNLWSPSVGGQTFSPLYITATGNTSYPYQLNFSSYMASSNFANINDVSARNYYDDEISTTYSNGVAKFKSKPEKVTYYYKTGYNDMEVTLSDVQEKPIIPPAIPGKFSNGKLNAKYSKTITVSADSAPYTWKMTSGDVPTGLKLTFTDAKAKLAGTPTKSGTFKFTLMVTDGNGLSVSKTFSVKITKPSISGTVSDTTVYAPYIATFKVTGGTSPYTWVKSSGTLPKGLLLTSSGDQAILSGAATKTGTFTFKIKATDKNAASVTKSFTVTVTKPVIAGTLSGGIVKAKYSNVLTVSGGASPYVWDISSGELPGGLTLVSSNDQAILSGTPTAAGTFKFKVRVTDKNSFAVSKSYSVKITQPTISGKIKNGALKANYSRTLTVSGGTKPYKWSITSGDVPAGLTFTYSDDKAVLSGTPTEAATYPLTIEVSDANGATATLSANLEITKPVISGTFDNGGMNGNYAGAARVAGGTAPYTWKLLSGKIPTGTKLTYNGSIAVLSGIPTKTGKFTFKLEVTDKNGVAASKSFTVQITKPAVSWAFKDGTVNEEYTDLVIASGGLAPYTWKKSSGTLPAGLALTFTDSVAVLSGTPTKAGTFTFKLKITDGNNVAVSKSFTVIIEKSDEAGTSSKTSSKKNKGTGSMSGNSLSGQTGKTNSGNGTGISLPETPGLLDGDNTNVNVYAELRVVSEDIVESYDGKDSDLVKVKAGTPLRFTVGDWGTDVFDVVVYVDDRALENVKVSGNGEFTLPVEVVHDDFKVCVKAQSISGKRESEELFIISE